MPSRVFYTTVFGLYEKVEQPEVVLSDCDYICFSNFDTYGIPPASHIKSPWKMKPATVINNLYIEETKDSRLAARHYKTRPFHHLPGYNTYVWQDSKVKFIKDVDKLVDQLGDNQIAAFPHQYRTNISQELEACIKYYPEEGESTMREQVECYLNEGFPKDYPLFETTVVIFNNKIELFFNMWWNEIKRWCNRDQLSFGYCLWKNSIECKSLSPGYARNNQYFVVV